MPVWSPRSHLNDPLAPRRYLHTLSKSDTIAVNSAQWKDRSRKEAAGLEIARGLGSCPSENSFLALSGKHSSCQTPTLTHPDSSSPLPSDHGRIAVAYRALRLHEVSCTIWCRRPSLDRNPHQFWPRIFDLRALTIVTRYITPSTIFCRLKLRKLRLRSVKKSSRRTRIRTATTLLFLGLAMV